MALPGPEPEVETPAQEYFLTLDELEDHVGHRHGWEPDPDYWNTPPGWNRKLLVDGWHGKQHRLIT